MPLAIERLNSVGLADATYLKGRQAFAAPGNSDWIESLNGMVLALAGNATSCTVHVERATLADHSDAVTVGSDITGAPGAIEPEMFDDVGYSFWRVVVEAVAGGTLNVVINARKS